MKNIKIKLKNSLILKIVKLRREIRKQKIRIENLIKENQELYDLLEEYKQEKRRKTLYEKKWVE